MVNISSRAPGTMTTQTDNYDAAGGNANAPSKQQIFIQSNDGERFLVDKVLIDMCPTAKHVLSGKRTSFRNTLGGSTFSIEGCHVLLKKEGRILASLLHESPEEVVVSLPEVKSGALSKVLQYCRHCLDHPDAQDMHRKKWEQQFVDMDQASLCELASAAYYLDVKPLVNLTSRVIASRISGMVRSGRTRDELRETFSDMMLDGDSPGIESSYFSTRYRLQRKLARSQPRNPASDSEPPEPESDVVLPPPVAPQTPKSVAVNDTRTVDELLKFIDGQGAGSNPKSEKRKKKKKTKRPGDAPDDGSETPIAKFGNGGSEPTNRSLRTQKSDESGMSRHDSEGSLSGVNPPSKNGKGATREANERLDVRGVQRKGQEEVRPMTRQHSAPVGVAKESELGRLKPEPTRKSDGDASVRLGGGKGKLTSLPDPDEVVWASDGTEDDYGFPPELQEALDREVEEFRRRLEQDTAPSQRSLGVAPGFK